jgi:hypothetical protein
VTRALRSVGSLVLLALVGLASACDKPPPPPTSTSDTAIAKVASMPSGAGSTVLCFGVSCAKGELCFDASHAHDAGAPFECYAVPPECGAKPSCDCLLEHHEFSCPAPNRLLCSETTSGEAQVVCVMIYQ